MDADRIKQLLRREENPKLDFKATLHLKTEGEKKELTRDVIAIANSRGGRGYILFGIEDKTKKLTTLALRNYGKDNTTVCIAKLKESEVID